MTQKPDTQAVQEELVKELKWGNEARARVLVAQLGSGPRQKRAVLEAMLDHPDALVRQAGAFGLGELGGAASIRRLEQQLIAEEARADYDGDSVIEEITLALSRIQESGARESLVRRLERVAAGKADGSDVSELSVALWKKRHPELIPAVRRGRERMAESAPGSLDGLLTLLEKSAGELADWALDSSVLVEAKTSVLILLEEDLPDSLLPALPAFIALAAKLFDMPVMRKSDAADYCDRLFSVLCRNQERTFTSVGKKQCALLRTVARDLIVATFPVPSIRAAVLLKIVGEPEDISLLETYCPAEPVLAKVFNDAVRALRERQKN